MNVSDHYAAERPQAMWARLQERQLHTPAIATVPSETDLSSLSIKRRRRRTVNDIFQQDQQEEHKKPPPPTLSNNRHPHASSSSPPPRASGGSGSAAISPKRSDFRSPPPHNDNHNNSRDERSHSSSKKYGSSECNTSDEHGQEEEEMAPNNISATSSTAATSRAHSHRLAMQHLDDQIDALHNEKYARERLIERTYDAISALKREMRDTDEPAPHVGPPNERLLRLPRRYQEALAASKEPQHCDSRGAVEEQGESRHHHHDGGGGGGLAADRDGDDAASRKNMDADDDDDDGKQKRKQTASVMAVRSVSERLYRPPSAPVPLPPMDRHVRTNTPVEDLPKSMSQDAIVRLAVRDPEARRKRLVNLQRATYFQPSSQKRFPLARVGSSAGTPTATSPSHAATTTKKRETKKGQISKA